MVALGIYISYSDDKHALKLLKYALSSGCLPYTDKFKKKIPFNFLNSITLWNEKDSKNVGILFLIVIILPDIYELMKIKI